MQPASPPPSPGSPLDPLLLVLEPLLDELLLLVLLLDDAPPSPEEAGAGSSPHAFREAADRTSAADAVRNRSRDETMSRQDIPRVLENGPCISRS